MPIMNSMKNRSIKIALTIPRKDLKIIDEFIKKNPTYNRSLLMRISTVEFIRRQMLLEKEIEREMKGR